MTDLKSFDPSPLGGAEEPEVSALLERAASCPYARAGLRDLARRLVGDEARAFEESDFAHDLLESPFPSLGILVARGVVPQSVPWDVPLLLDGILKARERLGLGFDDPAEATYRELFPGPGTTRAGGAAAARVPSRGESESQRTQRRAGSCTRTPAGACARPGTPPARRTCRRAAARGPSYPAAARPARRRGSRGVSGCEAAARGAGGLAAESRAFLPAVVPDATGGAGGP